MSVALSRIPGIDVPGLLRALDKYPYGCIEQTTSRALPLLYYNDVALLGYGPSDPRIPDRVQEAIYRIVDMQMPDGSFGMWGPYAPAAEWLQAYVLDFLLRARDQSMAVPAASLQRGLDLAQPLHREAVAQRPGLWLVRAGQGGPRRSRAGPLLPGHEGRRHHGRACLGAARRRAEPCRRARPRAACLRAWPASTSTSASPDEYYGSPLRDRAALLALATEAGGREGLAEVVNAVRERMVARIDQTTTQEQAWLVLAARAMSAGGELAYSVDGDARKAATEPVVINPDQPRSRAACTSPTTASGRSGCR